MESTPSFGYEWCRSDEGPAGRPRHGPVGASAGVSRLSFCSPEWVRGAAPGARHGGVIRGDHCACRRLEPSMQSVLRCGPASRPGRGGREGCGS